MSDRRPHRPPNIWDLKPKRLTPLLPYGHGYGGDNGGGNDESPESRHYEKRQRVEGMVRVKTEAQDDSTVYRHQPSFTAVNFQVGLPPPPPPLPPPPPPQPPRPPTAPGVAASGGRRRRPPTHPSKSTEPKIATDSDDSDSPMLRHAAARRLSKAEALVLSPAPATAPASRPAGKTGPDDPHEKDGRDEGQSRDTPRRRGLRPRTAAPIPSPSGSDSGSDADGRRKPARGIPARKTSSNSPHEKDSRDEEQSRAPPRRRGLRPRIAAPIPSHSDSDTDDDHRKPARGLRTPTTRAAARKAAPNNPHEGSRHEEQSRGPPRRRGLRPRATARIPSRSDSHSHSDSDSNSDSNSDSDSDSHSGSDSDSDDRHKPAHGSSAHPATATPAVATSTTTATATATAAKTMATSGTAALDPVFAIKPKKRPLASESRTPNSEAQQHQNPYARTTDVCTRGIVYESEQRFTRRGPHEPPPEEVKLSRQDVFDLENSATKIRDALAALRRAAASAATSTDPAVVAAANAIADARLRTLRATLHRAPFLRINGLHRHRLLGAVQELCPPAARLGSGLATSPSPGPDPGSDPGSGLLPEDICLDAQFVVTKWLQLGDFDPDLLRGINKTRRVKWAVVAAAAAAAAARGETATTATAAATGPSNSSNNGRRKVVTTSALEEGYRWKRDARVRGHNGLVVGQWWPLQICALRDGAHGVLEGGISVDVHGVAVSVILSGGQRSGHRAYDDVDSLNEILYCGTRGEPPLPPKAKQDGRVAAEGTPSKATTAMFRAQEARAAVRVIRSAKARDKSVLENYAPAEGFRYDGLYCVTARECLDPEFAMWRFRLERLPAQPAVRWCGPGVRPTSEERERWASVKDLWRGVP